MPLVVLPVAFLFQCDSLVASQEQNVGIMSIAKFFICFVSNRILLCTNNRDFTIKAFWYYVG
jgi:hypothetical protein